MRDRLGPSKIPLRGEGPGFQGLNKIGEGQVTIAETYEKAVDAQVTFSDGTDHRLSELWKKRPLLLVFLRHFG